MIPLMDLIACLARELKDATPVDFVCTTRHTDAQYQIKRTGGYPIYAVEHFFRDEPGTETANLAPYFLHIKYSQLTVEERRQWVHRCAAIIRRALDDGLVFTHDDARVENVMVLHTDNFDVTDAPVVLDLHDEDTDETKKTIDRSAMTVEHHWLVFQLYRSLDSDSISINQNSPKMIDRWLHIDFFGVLYDMDQVITLSGFDEDEEDEEEEMLITDEVEYLSLRMFMTPLYNLILDEFDDGTGNNKTLTVECTTVRSRVRELHRNELS